MKLPAAPLIVSLLFLAPLLRAVSTGDTYDSLIAEKGAPVSKIERGSVTVFNYPDAVIQVADGIVTSVKPKSADYAVHVDAPAEARPSPARAADNPNAPAKPLACYADYETALGKARSAGRPLFVLFTNSGRNIWCTRFDEEIFTQPEFLKYARDNLVLARLDYGQLPADQRVKTRELMLRFGIQGYPTAALVNVNGDLVGTLGYVKGGAQAFLDRLQQL